MPDRVSMDILPGTLSRSCLHVLSSWPSKFVYGDIVSNSVLGTLEVKDQPIFYNPRSINMGPFHFLSTTLSMGTDKHILSCTTNTKNSSVISFPSKALPSNSDTAIRDTSAFVLKNERFLYNKPNAHPHFVNEQKHRQLMRQSIALEDKHYALAIQATFSIRELPSTACT